MENQTRVNILLVDDQSANLLALEAVLESLGQNLVRANSGEEALRELIHKDFAVILLDVLMPGMNGFETADLIQARDSSRHLPIIFLTAGGKSEVEMFKGYAVGAIDYMLKPIRPAVLRSKVLVLINLYRKIAEARQLKDELALRMTEIEGLKLSLKSETENHTQTAHKLRRSVEHLKKHNIHWDENQAESGETVEAEKSMTA
jgi:CheY-like chemotaxis protein